MSTAARLFGYSFGFAYVALGVVAYLVTGFERWLEADVDSYVLWFRLNPTHNLVHLAIGTLLLWAGTEPEPVARIAVGLVGVLYLGVGIAGFWLVGAPDRNVLALNGADNVLHLVTGAAAVAVVGFSVSRTGRPSVRTPPDAR